MRIRAAILFGVADDEVTVLRDALSTHRDVLLGALHSNADLDIDRAFHIHAQMAMILARWEEFSAPEQRAIVATIEYVVNTEDDESDLRSPDGFVDDLEQLHKLQDFLGYV
ncbi:MAG: hypothetical protein QOF52_2572 [Propionibacteriaceae bacterium]|nr:hypothetical protein [Propionibacteriaceae bacterium]MDX6322714.1 hypothetical protein [Propionibacteriaceae bacterium]